MADEAVVVEESSSPAQSPLVAVTFQRNVHRKQKYLESEPKALGITQIGLSAYQVICMGVFLAKDLSRPYTDIPLFILSLLVVIAGSLAVAAQNLHLPTLRACLGMQIVSCVASIINVILCLVKMEDFPSFCWHYYYDNFTLHYGETCHSIENTQSHFFAESIIIEVTLLAISATLAAYCCKVVNCCGPAPKMPVITVQAPPVNSEEAK
ncbi:membrane-spanning 4-domains subfamily A member 4A-like [Symphorus nematophorus]